MGSPIAAILAASTLGVALKAAVTVFWVTWLGILGAAMAPFFFNAIRRRYDLQASGLSRQELKRARKEAKAIVQSYEARPPLIGSFRE
jgi:hypothetical protein